MLYFSDSIDSTREIEVIFWCVVGLTLLVPLAYRWTTSLLFRQKVTTAEDGRSGILFAYYTKGRELLPVGKGKIAGSYYETYITLGSNKNKGSLAAPGESVIYRVDLPFNTKAHLVGISNKTYTAQATCVDFVLGNGLEEVQLEGDFRSSFMLFAPTDQGMQARYVFDPAAMEFVVDFCSTHNWELAYDELYFTVSNGQSGGDMVAKSVAFIKQIQPAVIREFPSEETRRKKAPYGEYRGDPLKCPICQTDMAYNTYWHECPNGHGRLLHGQKLVGFRMGSYKKDVNEDESRASKHFNSLICPYCNTPMSQTRYMSTDLIIDSCTKCPYRWLDAGELVKIAPNADTI